MNKDLQTEKLTQYLKIFFRFMKKIKVFSYFKLVEEKVNSIKCYILIYLKTQYIFHSVKTRNLYINLGWHSWHNASIINKNHEC